MANPLTCKEQTRIASIEWALQTRIRRCMVKFSSKAMVVFISWACKVKRWIRPRVTVSWVQCRDLAWPACREHSVVEEAVITRRMQVDSRLKCFTNWITILWLWIVPAPQATAQATPKATTLLGSNQVSEVLQLGKRLLTVLWVELMGKALPLWHHNQIW